MSMAYRMANRRLHAKALRIVYGQSKAARAEYEEQLRWEKASAWNAWAVFREYDRLMRGERV